MEDLEVYHVLCIEEDIKKQKVIKKQFKQFPNIKLTFCKAEGDCRFILNTINIDMVIANLDYQKHNSLDYAKDIEKHSDVSPPIVFYSSNTDWEDSFHLEDFDCSYFLKAPLLESDIVPIIFQLLPGIERELEVAA